MFSSIEKYKNLCRTRTHPDFWHSNLIEAEKLCKDERESKHFMNYIYNPTSYSYDEVESEDYKTLGDIIDSGEVKPIKDLPANMETQMFKNGNEITIINKLREMEKLSELDDEKREPEESQ